jgi:hypothetical protein
MAVYKLYMNPLKEKNTTISLEFAERTLDKICTVQMSPPPSPRVTDKKLRGAASNIVTRDLATLDDSAAGQCTKALAGFLLACSLARRNKEIHLWAMIISGDTKSSIEAG